MDIYTLTKQIQKEFTIKRMNAEKTAVDNKEKAYSNPAYRKLEKLERTLVFEIGKLKASGTKTKDLEETLKKARETKAKLLKTLGLAESDLKPKYECSKCSDTGFIGTIPCECFEKVKTERMIQTSGFEVDPKITFAKFNSKVAKNEAQAENLEKLKTKLEDWCNKFPNLKKKILVFSGFAGVGKTFASKCIANEISKKGHSVCFVTAFQMNELFLKYHTTFGSEKASILTPLLESDLLVIDDLGTEPILTNVTINYLYLVLSERERFSKQTIITTNLSTSNLKENYGDRIHSRLLNKEISAFFNVKGDDLRF